MFADHDAMAWYNSFENLLNVAHYGYDNRYLATSTELLAFFEKPWHYQDLWEEYSEQSGA